MAPLHIWDNAVSLLTSSCHGKIWRCTSLLSSVSSKAEAALDRWMSMLRCLVWVQHLVQDSAVI